MTERRTTSQRRGAIGCREITDYLRLVEHPSAAYPVCEEQRQLARHIRWCFDHEAIAINRDQLATYIGYARFFPFDLLPWERFITALWLCCYRPDGLPRWPELFAYVSRGAGKNAFMAFLAFCLLSKANGIDSYDIDLCANSEKQATTSFNDLKRILDRDAPEFRRGFRWNSTEIQNLATTSTLRFWTSNADTKDGLRSGAVFFDEVHQYQSHDQLEVFETGLGKKDCPREAYFSSDGDVRGGVIDEFKEQGRKILSNPETCDDGGFLPFMCCVQSTEMLDDERNWHMANPSLRYLPNLMDETRREYAKWRADPARHTAFPTKRMNCPQGRVDIEVTSWENIEAASRPIDVDALDGKPCVIGIDYARTTDMIGATALFHVGDEWQAVTHAWWCTASADAGRIKAPLDEWAARGDLSIVDEVEVSPYLIGDWVSEQVGRYDVRAVAIDNYRYTLMRDAIEKAGFSATVGKTGNLKLVRPSDIMLVQPVINSLFATRKIAFGDVPIMRWFINNAKLEPAKRGIYGDLDNYVYGKIEAHTRKTDGFMAMVAAFTVADRIPEYIEPCFMPVMTF